MQIKVDDPHTLWIRLISGFGTLLGLWLCHFGLVAGSFSLIFAFSVIYHLIFSIFMFLYAIFMVKFLQEHTMNVPLLTFLMMMRYLIMFLIFMGLAHGFSGLVFDGPWMKMLVFIIMEAIEAFAVKLYPRKGE